MNQQRSRELNISFCSTQSSRYQQCVTSMMPKPYGAVGDMKALRRESQETQREYRIWSACVAAEDGRWLSTAVLKRQNVAHSSDRCSLITAACQHLEWRTVVVFERDPGLVMFWQSQSFSEKNKTNIYIDLTSNHIHSCSIRTDLCLKYGINERLNRKSAPTPPEGSVLLPGIQKPKGHWCSSFSPLVIIKRPVLRITLSDRSESRSKCSHSQNQFSSSNPSSDMISMVKTHQRRVPRMRKAAAIKGNRQRNRKRVMSCS